MTPAPIARLAGRIAGILHRRTSDILRERRCPVCATVCCPVSPDPPGPADPLTHLGLCPACTQALAPRTGGYCPACGELYPDATLPPHLCADCLTCRPPWRSLAFHAAYTDPLAGLITAFKFNAALGHARLLQALTLAAFHAHAEVYPDLIVPAPLHPRRLAVRGFNQSLELARPLAREIQRPLEPHALVRTRDTVPQARLSGDQRRANLKGAFRADPALVAGRRVLLVDDVMTTGTTLREATGALLAAGADGVDVLVIARA